MLSLVTAAEQQYRHESLWRDRELALLASIRQRREALAATAVAAAPVYTAAAPPVAVRPQRQSWARPIGARAPKTEVCTAACAVA